MIRSTKAKLWMETEKPPQLAQGVTVTPARWEEGKHGRSTKRRERVFTVDCGQLLRYIRSGGIKDEMEKPLEPPPPIYLPFKPQDPYLARVTNIELLEKPDPFADCTNGSERLQRLLDLAESGPRANVLLTRLLY